MSHKTLEEIAEEKLKRRLESASRRFDWAMRLICAQRGPYAPMKEAERKVYFLVQEALCPFKYQTSAG